MIVDELANGIGAASIPLVGGGNVTVGQSLFSYPWPVAPDMAVLIGEYPGEAGVHVKDLKEPVLERPRFQIQVRAKRYPDARLLAERVYRFLNGYRGDLGSVYYSRIEALSPPAFLRWDESGRALVVCNYKANKERSPLA